jgi:hypothetical protein
MPPDVLQPFRLIVLTLLWKFTLAPPGAPTSPAMQETSSRETGNCGREMSGNFANKWHFHAKCRDLLHTANLRHEADSFTSPLKEGTLRIFLP